jgi:hypothetical protein
MIFRPYRHANPNPPMIMTVSTRHAGRVSACPDDSVMIIASAVLPG